jgi:hypothetical protein
MIRLDPATRTALLLVFASVLVLLTAAPPATAAEEAPARRRVVLRDGWSVRQLEGDAVDPVSLAGSLARSDAGWLSTRMPAQVQDVLLGRGLIPDPRRSRDCTKTTWVFTRDWVYATTFPTPPGAGRGRSMPAPSSHPRASRTRCSSSSAPPPGSWTRSAGSRPRQAATTASRSTSTCASATRISAAISVPGRIT